MAKASFARHALIYGMGDVLAYAAGFFLLPLYLRRLSKAEVGTLELLNRVGEVVLLCLLFKGLRQALFSFHNQAESERERRSAVGSALFVTVLLLGAGGAITALAAEPISDVLELDESDGDSSGSESFGLAGPGLVRLAVVAVFAEALSALLLSLAQARAEATLFAAVSLGQFLLRVTLCIVFVACLDAGLEGILVASTIASGLVAVGLIVREVARCGLGIDRKQLAAMLRFALPFVPGGVGFFLLNSGDRFFLARSVDRAELGIYALGYKLALLVKLFSRQPLYRVWSARMYDAARKPDAPEVFGQVFTRILGVYVAVGLGLCLAAGEGIELLGGDGYARSVAIVVPVALAYWFLTAADLMESGLYIQRRTDWKLPITAASTVVILVLYALMIPAWGIDGAAWGTVLGFAFMAALTGLVTQRVFPVRYQWGRVTAPLAWAGLFWLGGTMLPVSLWMLPVKLLLWAGWLGVMWLTVLSDEEKRWLSRSDDRWPGGVGQRRAA